MLNGVVCVKVIDGELNPFDECAIEVALTLCDSVTVISMCPTSATDKLKALTRLGVRAILLSDACFAGSDTLATSYILSCAVKKLNPDVIFCGRQTIDGDTAQVGPSLATRLGYSLITNVMEMPSVAESKISTTTRFGYDVATLPALLTVERMCTLRFPRLRSSLGEVEVWNSADIGVDPSYCGTNGSPTKVVKVFNKEPSNRKCKMLEFGQLQGLVSELLAKPSVAIESQTSVTTQSLNGTVWAIGEAVLEEARLLSSNVKLLQTNDPYEIAELAKKERPDYIFWNADLLGRKNAPIVAALLNTGLCADCTKLEGDGDKLYMYRPAKAGNVIAKIECTTKPVMATVRTTLSSNDIVVSVGRGAIGCIDKIRTLANTLGAELCASRAVVDAGALPYSAQVGLTGKTIAPRIYIAIGISGAVHHLVGIENAEYVIAINNDQSAPIFENCDFGIIANLEDIYG